MAEKKHHHVLVQAPVAAVDVDGLAVVTVGTVLFALASVCCLVFRGWLLAHGHQNLTAISISGFALGLIGLAYCWNRRRRRPRDPRPDPVRTP